tara:strand:- start:225 stop:626 length:402 start_codon:yes stop_codon:yes gene_type:complete
MKRLLLPLITSLVLPTAIHAGEVKWVKGLNISQDSHAFFNGKCGFLGGCPSGKPIYGTVSIGQTIEGMKIGAIRCEKFNRTMKGWRGGPKYVSLAGRWNCKAARSRNAVMSTPGKNGERPFPWVYVIGAKNID